MGERGKTRSIVVRENRSKRKPKRERGSDRNRKGETDKSGREATEEGKKDRKTERKKERACV